MGERIGGCVIAKEQMVADVVVCVSEEVGADGGGKDFGTVVVGEEGCNGQDARCPSSA